MLLGSAGVVVDLEQQPIIDDRQPVVTALQADPVGLEAVAQPRLGDPVASLQFGDQVKLIVDQVGVDAVGEVGDHAGEQQPARTRRGVGRKVRRTERYATGGGIWAGDEDLLLG